MSDVAKWGILAALIVTVIALIVGTPFISSYLEGVGFLNSFGTHMAEFVNVFGDIMVTARRLLNNFLPARLVTITIVLTIIRRPLYFIIESATLAFRMLYK